MLALTPRPYQLVGRDFLAGRNRALLADEMRVGKTPQAILAAQAAGHGAILVLCPAIAAPHWRREFKRWWTPGSPTPLVDIYSYDKARNLWQAGDLKGKRWDVMIVDESHFAKNPKAKRTKMVYGAKGLGAQAGVLWALSGTPAPKHAGELWPMLRAFGATDLDYDRFLRRYCTGYVDERTRGFRVTGTKESMVYEVKAMLTPIMLRRTRKEVAPDMPDIDFQFLEVEPVRGVDLLRAGMGVLSDEHLLRRLEENPTDFSEDRQAVAMAKAGPLAEEILSAIGNGLLKQTVVFGWHKEPLRALVEALRTYGISAQALTGDTTLSAREHIQRDFREGHLQVICANILAAGTAIDLSAASHGYFLELDWVSGNNVQAANRLVSMEKKEPVTFDVVTWPGSTDDRVQRVLVRRVREINQLT